MWFRCRDLAAGFCLLSVWRFPLPCESRDARARHGDLARVAMRCAPNLGRRPDGDHRSHRCPGRRRPQESGTERVRGVGRGETTVGVPRDCLVGNKVIGPCYLKS